MSCDIKIGDMVSIIGDLKMGTVSKIIKESSGETKKVRIQWGASSDAQSWYAAEEVQKLLLG